MGEYAEMMLDGTCCSSCGQFIDIDGLADGSFEPQGFPGLCGTCAREERREARLPRFDRYKIKDNPKIAKPSDPRRQGDRMSCPFCVRQVKVTGFGDHMLTQHADKWPAQPQEPSK
jgi:hypothetical protein